MEYAIAAIEWLLVIYFFLSILYVSIFAFAGHFSLKRNSTERRKLHKIAVFIPAYKEDHVIAEVANEALNQQYPPSFYDVIVIADSLKEKTLQRLRQMPIQVIEVVFENSTKAKAINEALHRIDKTYDYALVLDADNVMKRDFLKKINAAFNRGCLAVQGHRKAKNMNSSYAVLDAASEEINNHIFRMGHIALGLSSGLIGSGMAFDYPMFKDIMSGVTAVGGFDKELEFELARCKVHIEYLVDAIVFDEKIQKPSDFSHQRRRWLATQIIYLKTNFNDAFKELFARKNLNFFDKVLQLMVPPRILLLGITLIATSIYAIKEWVIGWESNVSANLWLINTLLLITAFWLSFPKSLYSLALVKSLLSLPSVFIRMTCLLFKLKGANKQFIHTTHTIANK